jgi:HK97 family phage portal protein
MQMTETMQISVEQVARIYGIPLHMLQASNATTSFASVEAIGIEWLRLGLGPMIARIEAALQRLIIGETTFIKFNTDGLMRTTTKERLEALSIALASGMLSINEARAIEDRAPIGPAGDEYYMPLNMAVVGSEKGQE